MLNQTILTIGLNNYSILIDYEIKDFKLTNISQRRLNNLKKKVDNSEIKCVIIAFSENLFNSIKTKDDVQSFKNVVEIVKDCKKILLIKDFFIAENPTVYDFKEKREIGMVEVKSKIKELELLIEEQKKDNKIKVKELDKSKLIDKTIDEEYIGDLTSFQFKLEIIYKKQQELVSWLETYNSHLEKLEKLNQNRDIIKDLLMIADELSVERYYFKFFNEISKLIKDELIDIIKDELFNFYISHDSFYSQEFEDFIQLFEKYLRSIEGLEINLGVQKTSKGTLYVIKFLNKDLQKFNISESLDNFNEFLDLCNNSPDVALKIVEAKIPDARKALDIIQSLSKKYKRLQLDFQQQKERLELDIKQELQSELLELNISQTPLSLLSSEHGIGRLTNFNLDPVTLNKYKLKSKYEREEIDIIEAFEKYSDKQELIGVKSNLDKLKDDEIHYKERENSLFRLKKSLKTLSLKIVEHSEKIGIELLIKYLENKII